VDTVFWWGNLSETHHLKDLGIDGSIILKWIFKCWGAMDWIDLAQDRDKWQALLNVVMNLWVS
jgi:hypothetical protein